MSKNDAGVLSLTPELDKQSEIIKSGRAETVQDFYDWFSAQGLSLTKYESRTFEESCPGYGLTECADGIIYQDTHREMECPKCGGTGLVVVEREGHYDDTRGPEQLMADFFGIDRNRIEAERMEILERIRKANHEQE